MPKMILFESVVICFSEISCGVFGYSAMNEGVAFAVVTMRHREQVTTSLVVGHR